MASFLIAIVRDRDTIIPRGNVEIQEGDKLIICAEKAKEDYLTDIKEIELKKNHSWNGQRIRDLDISRQSFIVMVQRGKKMLVPEGGLMLKEGDKVLIYTKENKRKYSEESLF